jgi:hypothetical protein
MEGKTIENIIRGIQKKLKKVGGVLSNHKKMLSYKKI